MDAVTRFDRQRLTPAFRLQLRDAEMPPGSGEVERTDPLPSVEERRRGRHCTC
jgi:hypothetical protein